MVAISAGANRVAAASSDKNLTVWDLAGGKLLRTIPLETAEIVFMAVSPDGRRIFTGQYNGKIVVWDADSGKIAGDDEANARLARAYRSPWQHPTPESV